MESIRLPRFNRVAEIAAVQLTDRDRAIIEQVHRHRFLRSSHIAALLGGSTQQLLRRLQRLYHKGYLERTRSGCPHIRQNSSIGFMGQTRSWMAPINTMFSFGITGFEEVGLNRVVSRSSSA
jgi:hypothetical protein